MRKVPKLAIKSTRLEHNDDPVFSLRIFSIFIQYFHFHFFFFIFSLLFLHYVADLMVLSVLVKIKLGHAQIIVPIIGIPM